MRLNELTKKEWLNRCETVYDHYQTKELDLTLLKRGFDAIHRLEGNQVESFVEFMTEEKKRTQNFSRTLASDTDGYAVQYALSILSIGCQKCAEDLEAWHTRSGFCKHKE